MLQNFEPQYVIKKDRGAQRRTIFPFSCRFAFLSFQLDHRLFPAQCLNGKQHENLNAEESRTLMEVEAGKTKTCRMSPQTAHVQHCVFTVTLALRYSLPGEYCTVHAHCSHWLCSAHGTALPTFVRSCISPIKIPDSLLKNRIIRILRLRSFRVSFNKISCFCCEFS